MGEDENMKMLFDDKNMKATFQQSSHFLNQSITRAGLTGNEHKALYAIKRYTVGYGNRNEVFISQEGHSIMDLSLAADLHPHVFRHQIKRLVKKGILFTTKRSNKKNAPIKSIGWMNTYWWHKDGDVNTLEIVALKEGEFHPEMAEEKPSDQFWSIWEILEAIDEAIKAGRVDEHFEINTADGKLPDNLLQAIKDGKVIIESRSVSPLTADPRYAYIIPRNQSVVRDIDERMQRLRNFKAEKDDAGTLPVHPNNDAGTLSVHARTEDVPAMWTEDVPEEINEINNKHIIPFNNPSESEDESPPAQSNSSEDDSPKDGVDDLKDKRQAYNYRIEFDEDGIDIYIFDCPHCGEEINQNDILDLSLKEIDDVVRTYGDEYRVLKCLKCYKPIFIDIIDEETAEVEAIYDDSLIPIRWNEFKEMPENKATYINGNKAVANRQIYEDEIYDKIKKHIEAKKES